MVVLLCGVTQVDCAPLQIAQGQSRCRLSRSPHPNLWDVVAQAELSGRVDKQAGGDIGPGQAAVPGGSPAEN